MKIFLLVITVILLFYRIKHIPIMLSKNKYLKMVQDGIDKNIKNLDKNNSEKQIELAKIFALVVVFIFECLVALYYILLGSHIGITYFTILTVIQILTVIETCHKQLNMKSFSKNIDDYKFHRVYFLFNVILDLVYYPLAIYLLMR